MADRRQDPVGELDEPGIKEGEFHPLYLHDMVPCLREEVQDLLEAFAGDCGHRFSRIGVGRGAGMDISEHLFQVLPRPVDLRERDIPLKVPLVLVHPFFLFGYKFLIVSIIPKNMGMSRGKRGVWLEIRVSLHCDQKLSRLLAYLCRLPC